MSMRIGVNTLFLVPGDVGGAEIYLRNTLQELVKRNHRERFVLFTTRDNDALLRKAFRAFNGVEYALLNFRAAIRPLRIIAEQTLLPRAVRKMSLDLLWSPGYTAPVICACPQVVTVHDLQYKSHPDDLSLLERMTLDFLVKSACRRCDMIIAVSEFSKSEIMRFGMAPGEKVEAVLEGVETGFAVSIDDRESVSQTCPELPVNAPYMLCVAHSYPHKKVHVLVDAFHLVEDRIPHHLILVGTARRGEEHLKKSLDRIHDKGRVHRVHGLAFQELKGVYRHAALFALPSVYEGFGLPVLEAMMAGVPVITTSAASLPEVGGEYAVYVNSVTAEAFADQILAVLGWGKERTGKRVAAARKWAETFTWERTADDTMRVFKQVIHKTE